MGEARRFVRHPGAVRVLGLDLDGDSVAVASLMLSVAGNTHIDVVRVFHSERARQIARRGSPGLADDLYPVRALGEMISEVAECANAIAFAVASSRRDHEGGQAILACGPVLGLGMACGVPVIPLASAAIERALVGHQDADTAEIAAALDARIVHLGHELTPIEVTRRGAVIRAIASALVGLEELAHWRVPALSRPLRAIHSGR